MCHVRNTEKLGVKCLHETKRTLLVSPLPILTFRLNGARTRGRPPLRHVSTLHSSSIRVHLMNMSSPSSFCHIGSLNMAKSSPIRCAQLTPRSPPMPPPLVDHPETRRIRNKLSVPTCESARTLTLPELCMASVMPIQRRVQAPPREEYLCVETRVSARVSCPARSLLGYERNCDVIKRESVNVSIMIYSKVTKTYKTQDNQLSYNNNNSLKSKCRLLPAI